MATPGGQGTLLGRILLVLVQRPRLAHHAAAVDFKPRGNRVCAVFAGYTTKTPLIFPKRIMMLRYGMTDSHPRRGAGAWTRAMIQKQVDGHVYNNGKERSSKDNKRSRSIF